MSRPGRGQGGFSLIEVIIALIITGLIVGVSLQTFAFGTIELEKLGYRRQALALLDGEMEYWRARFAQADVANAVSGREAEDRDREVPLDPGKGLNLKIHSVVWPLQSKPVAGSPDLHCQRLRVEVTYRKVDLADTVYLDGPQYVR